MLSRIRNQIKSQFGRESPTPKQIIIRLEPLGANTPLALQTTIGQIVLCQKFAMRPTPPRGAFANMLTVLSIRSQHGHALSAVRTKHFVVALHLFDVLTKLSGIMKFPPGQSCGRRTIAHVIIFAGIPINPHFETFAPIEARWRVGIILVANLVFSTAVHPTPSVVAVGAVLVVYVELFRPGKVGGECIPFRGDFVARGALAAVVADEAAGTLGV